MALYYGSSSLLSGSLGSQFHCCSLSLHLVDQMVAFSSLNWSWWHISLHIFHIFIIRSNTRFQKLTYRNRTPLAWSITHGCRTSLTYSFRTCDELISSLLFHCHNLGLNTLNNFWINFPTYTLYCFSICSRGDYFLSSWARGYHAFIFTSIWNISSLNL